MKQKSPTTRTRRKKNEKSYIPLKERKISLGGECVEEQLPYPFVHYPGKYTTFLTFSESTHSEQYLCECCKPVVENWYSFIKDKNTEEDILKIFRIPDIYSTNGEMYPNAVSQLQYKPGLCHRCNLKRPTLRWCHQYYASGFIQMYGWYVKQNFFRLGTNGVDFIPDVCPQELKEMLQNPIENKNSTSWPFGFAINVAQYIENFTRQEFGIFKIGEKWQQENLLYNLICKIFPKEKIIRHYKPDWLEGLELDVWLPQIELAFEYQGQQHFHPNKAWGGEKALIALQERDIRKKNICEKKAIKFIEVKYSDSLTMLFIKKLLDINGVKL